jgi:membrane-bound serine protease (ClpP class)
MDSIVAYGLIVLGLVFLASELILPTFGVLGVLGLAGLVVGITMTFSPSTGGSTSQGMVTLIAVFILIPILGPLLLHYWPKTALGKRFFLTGTQEDDTLATMPTNLELEQLRGRYGKTVSALRPSGTVIFDGKRVDCLSEGNMIDPGEWVRCIDVRAGTVVVRQVERPPDLANMDPNDLNPV